MSASREPQEHVRVRRLPLEPLPESVPAARDLLRRVVAGTVFDARMEDAELALSEMVTNAVLHGREPIALTVTLTEHALRVEVTDANPVSPSFSMLDQTAVTGRGLLLISAVADRWGVDPAGTGKVVWIEVLAGQDAQTEIDVDALLASWGDELAQDPADECVRIVLTDLDVGLVARAEAHVEALLRELALVAAAGTAPAAQRRVAGNVLAAAAAVDPVRAELRHQLVVAVSRHEPRVDVTVSVRRADAEGVRDLAHALDEADRLSRTGDLLLAPAPLELSDARRAYLRRMLAQLGS
jgi:anti-sigma regulatory factor (Ser/Thr protein kinase)